MMEVYLLTKIRQMKKGVFIITAITFVATVIFLIRMIKKNNATESTASTSELSDNTTTNSNNFIGKIADLFNIKLPVFNTGSGSSSGNIDSGTVSSPQHTGTGNTDTGSSISGSDTNTHTDTGSGSSTIKGPTEPLPLRYKGGQLLYQRFNGELPPLGGYAFLVNGSVIYTNGITYDVTVGEYVDVQGASSISPYNSSGVNINLKLGYFQVSGTWVDVYQYNKFVNLGDYLNAIGFLSDGTIVYSVLYNEGTPEEYFFYYM